MISVLSYDREAGESQTIRRLTKDIAADISEEKWDLYLFSKLEDVKEFVSDEPLLDYACYDVTSNGSIDYLEQFRKSYRETILLLIADRTVSPMLYMKPGILASSLLLRPFDEQQAHQVLKEFLESNLKQTEIGAEDGYVIESREGRIKIPYSKIYYLEAREKKIFIRTQSEEYGFYATMEGLEEKLPEYFMRSHRSYVVNSKKIQKIMLSQNIILLQSEIEVPLSRSFKPVFKEFIRC